jgi:hypothetical protein
MNTDLASGCCLNSREEVTGSNAHAMRLRLLAVFLTMCVYVCIYSVLRNHIQHGCG